jgi:hypothetical protein
MNIWGAYLSPNSFTKFQSCLLPRGRLLELRWVWFTYDIIQSMLCLFRSKMFLAADSDSHRHLIHHSFLSSLYQSSIGSYHLAK